jgi:hypothetical protein
MAHSEDRKDVRGWKKGRWKQGAWPQGEEVAMIQWRTIRGRMALIFIFCPCY